MRVTGPELDLDRHQLDMRKTLLLGRYENIYK